MLVIKGAWYYDKDADTFLVPHFTGDFYIVDSDRYFTMEELKERYDDKYIEENEENYVEFRGTTYYYAEYAPWNTDSMELYSDLSELYHQEESFDWSD